MRHSLKFSPWNQTTPEAWSRCWNPGFPAMCFACLLLKYSGQEYDFFSLPRTTLLILSIIVEEANILPGLQLLLLPFFNMMFAATAEQAWTLNLLSAALYQSGLFLIVFKSLVNPWFDPLIACWNICRSWTASLASGRHCLSIHAPFNPERLWLHVVYYNEPFAFGGLGELSHK